MVSSIFRKGVSSTTYTYMLREVCERGRLMKSDLHLVCVVFRTDSMSYSDILIVVARLKWLGHLVGMEDNAPCGKTTPSQPESSRRKEDSEKGG